MAHTPLAKPGRAWRPGSAAGLGRANHLVGQAGTQVPEAERTLAGWPGRVGRLQQRASCSRMIC